MRSPVIALATTSLVLSSPLAHATSATQLATPELRPLLLTQGQAVAAAGTEAPGDPSRVRCGRQSPGRATYCSRIWDRPAAAAHPSIVTIASFGSPSEARAQVAKDAAGAQRAGTVVERSSTRLLYYVTGLPDVGTAVIAEQVIGSTFAYAWCSAPPDLPVDPTIRCAQQLLARQVAKAKSG